MCGKVLEKPKRAYKGVRVSIKLDVIKCFDDDEQNRDTVHPLNLPVSTLCTVYMQRERILKAADVTTGFAASKVVSSSRHPVMDKMGCLLLVWADGVQSMVLSKVTSYLKNQYF